MDKMNNGREKIIVFDTTLRDGEQAPGAALNEQQKLEIAYKLEELGVDVIEAGFPIASQGDFRAVELIGKEIRKSIICGLARSLKKDIEVAYQALKKSKHPRIHVFLATSKIHMQYKLRKNADEILDLAKHATICARNFCNDVEFSPEDASRSERDFLYKVIEEVIKAGATTINIPDTVGWSYPEEFGELIKGIINNVPNINKAIISVHCHNDLGLAVANSLFAIQEGARQVHCTINGIGERAGNTSLEELVMVIKTRRDIFKNFYTDINTKKIIEVSRLVSNLTGFVIAPNKAIVGKNAFRHESGIHQDGVLKKRLTYEIIDPKDVGIKDTEIVLGKHSGRHAFAKKLRELGYKLSSPKIESLFVKFKELADKKKEVFDEDIRTLLEEELHEKKSRFKLISSWVVTGSEILPHAKIKIDIDGEIKEGESKGDGPIDACFKAIDKITKIKAKLLSYKLDAITSGKDALGKVRVELKVGKRVLWGWGASTDIIESSIKAYLDALDKL